MTEKHIVITGAGSGLGASLAKKHAEQGHYITLIGRTESKLQTVAKDFPHSNYSLLSLDVFSYEAVDQAFDEIMKVKPIDVLINNAGLGYFELAEDLTVNQVDEMIDINLKGTIFCTQKVLPAMKESDKGSLINIVSTAGLEGKVTESVYCASKFGVKGFTESIIKELEDTDIHVTAVYMGGMRTPFWDGVIEEENMGGLMDPEDIADIIIENVKIRKNINVPEVVIKNH